MNHPSPFANAIRAIKIDYVRDNVSFALSANHIAKTQFQRQRKTMTFSTFTINTIQR